MVDVKASAIKAWVVKMAADEVGAPTIENAFGLADAVDRQPEVVRLLAYTGLRWGEMAALRVCDFDMLRRRVNVSRSVTESGGLVWSTPKTWERRSVPFPASIADELAALMVDKGRDDLVFTDMRGGVLRNSNWRARVFEPTVRKCHKSDESFPSITPHDLRHTAASLAVSARANVKAVQRMLGHAKASMTLDVYADLFDADLGRRGCEPGRRNSSRCRRGPRGRDPVSLPVTAVWAAVWPPPVGSARSAAGWVLCDGLSAN